MNIPNSTSTTLFNGKVPPNAFMVQVNNGEASCYVNDNGAANNLVGFALLLIFPNNGVVSFVTPPGYKPIGPVSIWCNVGGPSNISVTARGW
jgi:hypothetical protein